MQVAARSLHEFEENRVPNQTPGAARILVHGDAVAEEPKSHPAMLGANRIVEAIALVANGRQALDGRRKITVLPAAPALLGIDQSQPTKVVVPRSVKRAESARVLPASIWREPMPRWAYGCW